MRTCLHKNIGKRELLNRKFVFRSRDETAFDTYKVGECEYCLDCLLMLKVRYFTPVLED